MLARAAHANVYPAQTPEIGWCPVELTGDAADDPLLGPLPARFDAFQWHYYTHDLPDGAVELARSSVCTQAYRLGDRVWGVQFHPEVTAAQVDSWIEDEQEIDGEALRTETAGRIEAWNGLGRDLCGRFLDLSADR